MDLEGGVRSAGILGDRLEKQSSSLLDRTPYNAVKLARRRSRTGFGQESGDAGDSEHRGE